MASTKRGKGNSRIIKRCLKMKVHLLGLENKKTRRKHEDGKLWFIGIFKEEKKEIRVCCV